MNLLRMMATVPSRAHTTRLCRRLSRRLLRGKLWYRRAEVVILYRRGAHRCR